MERNVLLEGPFFLANSQSGVQSVLRRFCETLWTDFAQNSNISSRFQKWGATASQVCRAAIIRPALESSDPDASNGGSHVGVWLFGADLIAFEKAELTKKMFFVKFFADFKLNFWSTTAFQNPRDRPHSVRFRRLARHSMREDQSFPAHFESKKCDIFGSLWGDFSENWSKMCPQTAGDRIAPQVSQSLRLIRIRWKVLILAHRMVGPTY